jgi:nitrite reductase/ring-hydroxylating ferredoxin subunit
MWIPVLESKRLGREPVRVVYWGSPVVLFRTESGVLGALDDACAHRGIPLSRGAVRGDALRCGYHHFAFDTGGQCVSVPEVLRTDEDFRRGCTVKRYHVKEALGHIFISVEPEPDALFPVDAASIDVPNVAVMKRELEGHVLVWMDHFSDGAHIPFAHWNTLYWGSPEAPARAEIDVGFATPTDYKSTPSNHGSFFPTSTTPLWMCFLQSPSVTAFLGSVLRGASRVGMFRARGAIVSPSCLDFHVEWRSEFGRFGFRSVIFHHELAPGRIAFIHFGITDQGRGGVREVLERRAFRRFAVHAHVEREDGIYLTPTRRVDVRDFHLTPVDGTSGTRIMLARYLAAKSHLFAKDSLIHKLAREPGLMPSSEAGAPPRAPETRTASL